MITKKMLLIDKMILFGLYFGVVIFVKKFIHDMIDIFNKEVPIDWGLHLLFAYLFLLFALLHTKNIKQFILYLILAILLLLGLAALFAFIQVYLL